MTSRQHLRWTRSLLRRRGLDATKLPVDWSQDDHYDGKSPAHTVRRVIKRRLV